MYRVLIIDDEPWSRKVVRELGEWEDLKLEVIGEAEDGTEGLGLIKELNPNIVITDMRMPGVEGVELLRQMKEQFPNLKIIVMSGYDDFAYLKQAIQSRAMEYLLKPVDPDELNNALKQCIKELDDKNVKLDTSSIFTDTNMLDMYLSLRQQILWHMLELNKPAVLYTFEKLMKFLKKNISASWDQNIQSGICQDFIVMLREFISENEVEFIDFYKDNFNKTEALKPIQEAVLDISSIYGENIDAIEDFRKNKKRFNISEIKSHIDKHFMEPISLETIAQSYFISKEYLSRTFKTFTGENISDYIIRKRMEKARDLILRQKLAIKHAAEMVGYTDIAYFYRVFKKHFDITPGDLRKEDSRHVNKVQ